MIFEGIKAKRETPTRVIFGTDWWSDCDDVAALAILLKAHKHGLIEAQKALVENSDVLAAAQTTYADLQAAAEQLAADTAAADAVEALIAEIGEVTYTDESKAKIDAAQTAFDALTEAQKALVENSDVLAAAHTTYADLQAAAEQLAADTAAADAVEALIAEIGEVTYTDESKAKIDAAQAAFDALTEAQKALVENSDVLAATQARYAELKVEAEKDDGKASSLSSLFAMILSFLKYLFDFFTKMFR